MEKESGKIERIALWDNIKLLLIILVVLGHFADFFTAESSTCRAVFMFIYAFHMPAFFFISGLFHSDKNVDKKCIYFLISGVMLRIFIIIFGRLYGNKNPKFPLFNEDGVPWFLYVLAAYVLIAWLLRKQNFKFLLLFCFILGCFYGYDKSLGDFLCISRIIVFAPFYFAGKCLPKESILDFKNKHKLIPLICMLVFIAWGLVCFLKTKDIYFLRGMFTGRHPFYDKVIEYGPLWRAGCYLLQCILCFSLIMIVPSVNIKWITGLGTKTLNVYFWHWIIYMTLEHFFGIKKLFYQGTYGKVLFVLISVPVAIIIAAVPVFDFPLKQVKKAVFKESEA